MKLPKAKAPEDYARTTYDSPHFLVRHGHRRRFSKAVEVVDRVRPKSLLDYGAGDGAVLKVMEQQNGFIPERIVAYDPSPEGIEGLKEQLSKLNFPASATTDLASIASEKFDLILCLEVLEHMPLLERFKFYRLCAEQLNPGGRCLIDVPVEIGPTLLVKHLGRVYLKARPSEYRITELGSVVLGAAAFDPARFDPDDTSTWIQNHKGFDYRLFAKELRAHFVVEEAFVTPLDRLPAWLFNQEIFFLVSNRPA